MHSLVELDLTGNFIQTLQANTFESLINLRNLALARNRLATFNGFSFYGLTKLEQLDLSENAISSFDEIKNMKWMINLKLLILNENPNLVLLDEDSEEIYDCLRIHLKNLKNLNCLFLDSKINLNAYFYDGKESIKFYYSLSDFESIKNRSFKLN